MPFIRSRSLARLPIRKFRSWSGKERVFVVSICRASAAAWHERERLQLPRIILKNNVFFNSEPGPLSRVRRWSAPADRVCLYFFWPAGCALICNCVAVFTREFSADRKIIGPRASPIELRELLCFAFSAGDGWNGRERERERDIRRERGGESGRTERSLLFRGLKLICMGPTAKRLSCRAWFRFDTPTNCGARVPPRAGRYVIFAKTPLFSTARLE